MEDFSFSIEPVSDVDLGYVETIPHPRLRLVGVKHTDELLEFHLEHLLRLQPENIDMLLLEGGDYFKILELILLDEFNIMGRAVNIDREPKWTKTKGGLLQSIDIGSRSFVIELMAFLLPLTVFPAGLLLPKRSADFVFYSSFISHYYLLYSKSIRFIGLKAMVSEFSCALQRALCQTGIHSCVNTNGAQTNDEISYIEHVLWSDFTITARSYFMGCKILEYLDKYPDKKICAVMGMAHTSFLHKKFLHPEGIEEIKRKARRYWRVYRLFYGDFYPKDYIK